MAAARQLTMDGLPAPGSRAKTALWVLVILAVSGCGEGDTKTPSYPSRPIKLIVPFAAGGGTDSFARIIKKAIEDENLLEQPLVIINIDGAGATIGSRRAKNAKPDGYTMLILHDAILTAQASATVNYGPEAFEPIAGTGEVGLVVAVGKDSPYHTLEDLMEDVRQRPNEVIFGANMGAITHYAGLQLEAASKKRDPKAPPARFRFVPVGGGSNRFAALKGGHIHVTGFSIEEFIRFRADGVRGLAFLGEEIHPAAPKMKTAIQQGYQVTNSNVFYWWFPQGTDQKKIDKLALVLEKAMNTDFVQTKMDEIQCQPIYLRGEDLQRRLQTAARQYDDAAPHQELRLPNFPAIVLVVTLCLATLVVGQSFFTSKGLLATPAIDAKTAPFKPRPALALICVAFTLFYLLALTLAEAKPWGLNWNWISFRPATVIYVLAIGVALTRMNWRRLPYVLLMALFLSIGLYELFTKQLSVVLP